MTRYAVLLLATACTYHHTVTTLPAAAPSTPAIAQLSDGRDFEVIATSTPAGVRWIIRGAARTAADGIVDPAALRGYTTVRHGRGRLEGLGIGACAVRESLQCRSSPGRSPCSPPSS